MRHNKIWIVGDLVQGEWADVVRWVAESADIRFLSAPPAGTDAADPDVILFLQSWPGQFSPACLHRWRSQAPFATIAVLEGVFCEGNSRGRKLLHGVNRMAWHEWPRRLPTLLGIEQPAAAPEQHTCSTLLAISMARRDAFLAHADACRALGFSSVWQATDVPLTATGAGLWLCNEWSALRDNTSEPAILLQSFPRPHDRARAAARGVSHILAKPLRLNDLHAAIAASLGISRIPKRPATAA